MSELYPWQQDLWRRLMPGAAVHHALLLRGPRGVGKRRLAQTLAQSALCTARRRDYLPCGACKACAWFAQNQHPDFMLFEPQTDNETQGEAQKKSLPQIKIEQVRDAVAALVLSTHQGGRRVIMLAPAESMNAHAANALLKTLEEPTPGTQFLLLNQQRGALPATIVSRCQAIDIALPPRADALAWLRAQQIEDAESLLALAGGAPLLALEKAAAEARAGRDAIVAALQLGADLDPIASAERLRNVTTAQLVETVQTWNHDLIAAKLGLAARYHLQHSDSQRRASATADLADLLALQRKLIEAKRLAHHPLNARLVAEDLLLAYRAACG